MDPKAVEDNFAEEEEEEHLDNQDQQGTDDPREIVHGENVDAGTNHSATMATQRRYLILRIDIILLLNDTG